MLIHVPLILYREVKYVKSKDDFYTIRGYNMKNAEEKLLTPSMEDYLEMIYRICKDQDYIRISQLAKKLNVQPSSATKIVQKLRKLSMVKYEKYGIIQLTDEGEKLGEFLLKRHNILYEFLNNIGTEDSKLEDTEMIEHVISLSTLRNIYILNEFISRNPDILDRFKKFKSEICKKDNFLDLLDCIKL